MLTTTTAKTKIRYQDVTEEKSGGATYTPTSLANFVSEKIVELANLDLPEISILDPAIGDGELILSILHRLSAVTKSTITVHAYDLDSRALNIARQRVLEEFPDVIVKLHNSSFLDFSLANERRDTPLSLFDEPIVKQQFDLIIANPPYVRTQIIGAYQAQALAGAFGLSGRVDLYHAFLIGMAQVLKPGGTAGIIVSNRFMTTRGGAGLRAVLRTAFDLRAVWDLGDTKLFDAAVLPAVILAKGPKGQEAKAAFFASIYETEDAATSQSDHAITALTVAGVAAVPDGRRFRVQHGTLDATGGEADIWRIATPATDTWLAAVARHTWRTFGDIGKIRVGVKTCADNVFIRSDWDETNKPELLRPLTTHHGAGRFRATTPKKVRSILYPHEVVQGRRRAVDLSRYPKSQAYLETHRKTLAGRTYVIEGGREWYELWVPQDPAAWDAPKLVFRDISEHPTFWIDLDGTIVNGDCYWLTPRDRSQEPLLWLAAAVANSTFIEAFYDRRFNNKLYAGRRRFITQYVELFPLPDPKTPLAQPIVERAKMIYEAAGGAAREKAEMELNSMIWQAFGLAIEEVPG